MRRTARLLPTLLVAVAASLAAAPAAGAQSSARYRVTFEATWSAATHPEDFPPNPHFSGLVGALHDATAALWAPGTLASEGIEQMAETGSKTALLAEVEALRAAGQAGAALSGGGVAVSPGAVALEFEVTEAFPLVTLVSMLAPSPDWFVGVDGLSLYEGGAWVPERVVALHAYDAGTDSGRSYTAPDEDTVPPAPVFAHTEPPFLVGGALPPVGRFVFTRLSTTGAEPQPPDARALVLDAPFPNPAAGRVTLRVHVAAPRAVYVEVLDALGRRAALLHDGPLAAGTHALVFDGGALAPGVYVVRARSLDGEASRRVVVGR